MYININIELLKNRMPIVQLAKELELSRNTVAKKNQRREGLEVKRDEENGKNL